MKKRILVINFGGLGDQILFFPVLKTLEKVFNDPFITLITESRSKSANSLTDVIDDVFISELKSGNKLFSILKIMIKAFIGKYDLVVSSGSSKFVSILLFLTGIKERIGYDSGSLSRILLTKAVPLNQDQYAASIYHDLVCSLCNSEKAALPEVKIELSDEKKYYIEDLVLNNSLNKKKIVIHPGASKLSVEKGIIKCWAADRWTEFIKNLLCSGQYKVIFTGGPDDKEIFSEIRGKLAEEDFNRDNLLDLTDKSFTIDEFAYIVKLADMLVCVDSAPMHIAVGLKKHVISLFGPTNEEKLLPVEGNLFIPVVNNDITCRPCLWHKRQTSCDRRNCLDIKPDQVFAILNDTFHC